MLKKIMLGVITGTTTVAVAFGLVSIKNTIVPKPIRSEILVYNQLEEIQEAEQDGFISTFRELLISEQLKGFYIDDNDIIWDFVDDELYNDLFDDYLDDYPDIVEPFPDVDFELNTDDLPQDPELPELEFIPPQSGGDGILPESEEMPELEYIPPQGSGGSLPDGEQPDVVLPEEGEQPEVVLPDDGEQPEVVLPDDGEQPEVVLPDDGEQPEVVLPDDGEQPEVVLPNDGAQPEIVLPSDGAQPEVVLPSDGAQQDVVVTVIY